MISHPEIQLAINRNGLYLLSVKEKDKKWGQGLALKVLIRFKIVYSTWKPVIWKYNFSNSLNVESSSFDSYRVKGNPLFYMWLNYMWSQVFCLWLQRVAVFFYFLTIIRHKEPQRLSQLGHKNRLLQTCVL